MHLAQMTVEIACFFSFGPSGNVSLSMTRVDSFSGAKRRVCGCDSVCQAAWTFTVLGQIRTYCWDVKGVRVGTFRRTWNCQDFPASTDTVVYKMAVESILPTMLPSFTKVLIVGAGPTGLCTAISLVKHGVSIDDITIVDAILEGENSSRATVVHSATLEVCNSVFCIQVGGANAVSSL
jgi:hypothetical protein